MAKPGEDLQRLVRVIERAANRDGNLQVESPKRLPDKDTGRLREHDVVLTFVLRHHTLRMAVECRDRSRKIGVPDVEAFHFKCQRTGIDRGVMVSSRGFTGTALRKADGCNIGCLSLEEATSFDWCLAPGVQVLQRRMIQVYVRADPERPVEADAKLYSDGGVAIGTDELMGIGRNCMKELPLEPTEGPVKQRFVDHAPKFHLVDVNGDRLGVRRLNVDVT